MPTDPPSRAEALEVAPRGDAELLEYLAKVIVHRVGTDEKLTSNLPARCSLGRQSSDLKLPGREVVGRFSSSRAGAFARRQQLTRARSANALAPMVSNIS